MNPLLAFTAWSAQGTITDCHLASRCAPQNKGLNRSRTRVVQRRSHHDINVSVLTGFVNAFIH